MPTGCWLQLCYFQCNFVQIGFFFQIEMVSELVACLVSVRNLQDLMSFGEESQSVWWQQQWILWINIGLKNLLSGKHSFSFHNVSCCCCWLSIFPYKSSVLIMVDIVLFFWWSERASRDVVEIPKQWQLVVQPSWEKKCGYQVWGLYCWVVRCWFAFTIFNTCKCNSVLQLRSVGSQPLLPYMLLVFMWLIDYYYYFFFTFHETVVSSPRQPTMRLKTTHNIMES